MHTRARYMVRLIPIETTVLLQ